MRKLIQSVIITLLLSQTSGAATRFVSQSGGLFGGGTNCNGQTTIPVSTFNGTSQSAGDINWLCGTISSALTPSGNGSSGNVVSIKFDTGSKMSFAAVPTSGAIVLTGLSFYLIDGGGGSCGWVSFTNTPCNVGSIASTANGTGQANQIASIAIYAQNASNIEIKGLLIGPLYTHTSTSDTALSPPGAVCVLFQGGDHFNIHNNTFHDIAWCIDGGSATGVVTVNNNEFYNVDHGLGMGGPNTAISVHDNHFHDFANWDTGASNIFHHDGIHFFGSTGSAVTNSFEYNNLFDGDPGFNWTADIYNEGLDTGIEMYNNVAIVNTAGRQSCCGILDFYGNGFQGANNIAYNNTIYGAYVAGSGGCFGVQAQTNVTVENNVAISCNGIMDVDAASTIGTIDFNAWDDVGTSQGIGGSANTFSWHGSQFSSFTTWKADCSCDSHSVFGSISSMKMTGPHAQQISGSPLIGAGTNLTSSGFTGITLDILGNARPGGATAWDIGAFFGAASAGVNTVTPTAIQP